MNRYVYFKSLLKDEYYIQNKTIKNNIDLIKTYKDEKYFYYLVNLEDYNLLLKIDYRKTIIFDRYYGFLFVCDFLKNNLEKIILSVLIVFIIFLSKLFIYKVNIRTDDIDLQRLIMYSLEDEGVKNFSIAKKFTVLNNIKNKVSLKYKDNIEWLEITKDGYIYNVDIIKRKKNNIENESSRCNYIALKSGNIRSIKVKKGVALVQENNFVNAGDVLITGQVVHNEEIKTEVCANGIITGEVWYKVNVNYPLKKKFTYKKNNGKYNLKMSLFNKNYYLFNNKNKNNKKVFKFLNITLVKQVNTYEKTISYTMDEALDKALSLSKKKVLEKLPKNSKILSQNILKKDVKNDKIYLEVLVTVEEELGVIENY